MRRRFLLFNLLSNFINYSSFDNQIVTPYRTDFGSILLKNVMVDGIGTLLFRTNVTKIGDEAFSDRSSLTSINIPDSVTEIGEYAFWYCARLASINIPNRVTKIGDYAFSYCTSLTSVYCKATTPPTLGGSSVFSQTPSGRKIYVPYQSLDAYKTAKYWSKYADNIVGYDFENNTIV